MAKIVIIGPAHPLRGGLATFNQRLAKEFNDQGHDCSIYSFSLQYPSFIFPGTTQYTNEPAPENLTVHTVINSINPFNWIKIGNRLKKDKPDLVIVRFWLPLMGPALGTILRRIKKNKHTRIICIADNVIPHEKRPGDKPFTRYFLKSCDAFITMSEKVMADLRLFEKEKPASLVMHPLYDNFGAILSKEEARTHLQIPMQDKIILFFGFIRNYKGLDLLLEAMPSLKGIRLLVAGEFYEDEKTYQEQIDRLQIRDQLILRTDFIPDSEVKYYLCAVDAVIQPYRNATQSGVTPLAFHFEKPMVVTNVGGLPAMVTHNEIGIVTEPEPAAIAKGIEAFYAAGEAHFIPFIREKKKSFSWQKMTEHIFSLYETLQH
ncbi:MAG: glycosyltransferase [Bacteroidetes bacterium]|nr:glycosyltransferase [Bacteroidota bacterium]